VPDQKTNEWFGQLQLERLGKQHILTFFREKLLVQHMLKRTIDIVGSILLLAVLSPVMVVTAVLIKVTSIGPFLFAQERVGINQRPFRLFKFRSMVADAEWQKKRIQHLNEQTGPVFKIRDDPRVTTFGRLLRKTSIDELPQLFNVLRGEMSLVGPRPPLLEEVRKYEWHYRKRLSVMPGLTCIWPVSGRNQVSFERWMEMDHEYIEKWSLWLDLKILFATIPAVLFGRGAS
jgi:exopolysaccharide biosynthesis polyprenyl glycosylphosphotransferase